jgi:hypothetical protein
LHAKVVDLTEWEPARGEVTPAARAPKLRLRDIETIDAELRLQAAMRRSIREHGGEPPSRHVDDLLDERLAHRGRTGAG